MQTILKIYFQRNKGKKATSNNLYIAGNINISLTQQEITALLLLKLFDIFHRIGCSLACNIFFSP